MARVNPVSSSMQLVLNLGMEGEKEINKSIPVSKIDVNADADALFASAQALATLVEFPVVTIKRNTSGIIAE